MKQIFFPVFLLCATLAAASAQAWDPNEGAQQSAPKPALRTMTTSSSWSSPQQTVWHPPTPGPRGAVPIESSAPIPFQPAQPPAPAPNRR